MEVVLSTFPAPGFLLCYMHLEKAINTAANEGVAIYEKVPCSKLIVNASGVVSADAFVADVRK